MKSTFQDLWTCWPWRPIRNCPGRFVLPWTEHSVSFETLLGTSCTPQTYSSPEAKDSVLVVPLTDGGLISYQQTDGRLIHTLNTPEGFSRKLHQLGITLQVRSEKQGIQSEQEWLYRFCLFYFSLFTFHVFT